MSIREAVERKMKIRLIEFLKKAREERKGNVAMTFAMMWFMMFGTIMVSIDVGRAVHVEDQLQSALDAAAIAALKAGPTSGPSVGTQIFNLNTSNSKATFTQPVFEVLGNGSVKATATATVETLVATLMNTNDISIDGLSIADPRSTSTTSSTSTSTASGPIPCLHIMDQSGAATWKMISNSNLRADTCDVYVRSNSSVPLYEDSDSDVSFHNVWIKGPGMQLVGGEAMQVMNNPYKIQYDMPVVGDPYEPSIRSVVQVISNGSCTNSNTNKTYRNITVNPGTYCGAVTFDGVRFNPGLYIIASGSGSSNNGALTLKGKLDGSAGVTFYFGDSKSQWKAYQAAEESVLVAPTTGLTRGLLFFENSNRGSGYDFSISSINKQTWKGLIYLPSVNMKLDSLSEWSKWVMSLEVNQLQLKSTSAVWEPFPWIPYNATQPVSYDPAAFMPVANVTVENPIYLSK